MSLNGLDDPKIKDAHDAAVAEPGGWFLLRYTSRDEVELLGRGSGGIVEVRDAIAAYDEVSPLYGFLRYRRRTVLLKYLPEACSRLVQARSSVHFNSFSDRFSPHDTTFSITTAKGLTDTKLSAACSLHAASGSTSSSTSSIRRRRLNEIAEEEEEAEEDDERQKKRQSIAGDDDRPRSSKGVTDSTSRSGPSSSSHPPVTLNSSLATSSEQSHFAGTAEPPSFTGAPRPSSDSFEAEALRRRSLNSVRPDFYGSATSLYGKPKVKLGPRPSLDVSGRPRTSAGAPSAFRPISTMPARFRLAAKGLSRAKMPDSTLSNNATIAEEGPEGTSTPFLAPTSASAQRLTELEITRPHTSSGATPRFPPPSMSMGSNLPPLPPPPLRSTLVTPEKARLMKAMKLREQKKKMSMMPPLDAVPIIVGPVDPTIEEEPSQPPQQASGKVSDREPAVDQVQEMKNDDADAETQISLSHVDSAIAIDLTNDQASVATRTESHPPSPIAESSEIGDSTKASSLSESTDETLQPGQEDKGEPIELDERLQSPDLANSTTTVMVQGVQNLPTIGEAVAKPMSQESAAQRLEHVPVVSATETSLSAPKSETEIEHEAADEQSTVPEASSEHSVQEQNPTAAKPKFSDFEGQKEGLPSSEVQKQSSSIPSAIPPSSEFPPAPAFAVHGGQSSKEEAISSQSTPSARSTSTPQNEAWKGEDVDFKIPVSIFSTQAARNVYGSASRSALISKSELSQDAESREATPNKEAAPSETESASSEKRRSKQKPNIEPIVTDINHLDKERTNSTASLSDDDELMEELQSATLHQAKPMTVSKSPLTPVFPGMSPNKSMTRLDSGSTTPHLIRTVSSPVRGPVLTPTDYFGNSVRTVSAGPTLPKQSDLRPKNGGKLGSSISQRIKALQNNSAASTSATSDTAPKERPTSTFYSIRKKSAGELSSSPSIFERANSIARASTPSPTQSRESSPETGRFRDRSDSMASRLSKFEGGNAPRGHVESVQVTARIVREHPLPLAKFQERKADPSHFEPLNLKSSPLTVDHQKAGPAIQPEERPESTHASAGSEAEPEPQKEHRLSIIERRFSKNSRSQSQDRSTEGAQDRSKDDEDALHRPKRRSSLTIVRDFIKDRRDSLLGGVNSASLEANASTPVSANLASPPMPNSARSSRPPSVHQNSSIFGRRLSIGSRRSSMEVKSPAAIQPPTGGSSSTTSAILSPSSTAEQLSLDSDGEAIVRSPSSNGSNRASRFMRRLSNSFSGRKHVSGTKSISPTLAEEDEAPTARSSTSAGPSIVAYMGDVNVQFPDTLLWKRRSMCLDSHGFLILSTVPGAAAASTMPNRPIADADKHHHGGAIKRYHLSDFKRPYIPEMEVQELPNSVVLDFVDGSGLQIACEDRSGQINILHFLEEAHQKHTAFGQ